MARNKEFDENEVLEKAVWIFWEQGYEKTSMSDLVEHMGIHRRSLYDTFGNKHALFMKAMDRRSDKIGVNLTSGVMRAETATQALQFIFNYTIQRDEGTPPGCMFVNSAVELASHDVEVDVKVTEAFKQTEQRLKEIITWGQEKGEFTLDYDAEELAEYLHSVLTGLKVMVRTSTPKEKLYRTVKMSLKFLEK